MQAREETGVTRRRFDGVVFDLDGTLVNSEQLHYEAWLAALPSRGITLDAERYATSFSGRPGLDIARHHLGLAEDEAVALMDELRDHFWQLAPGRLALIPGLPELLARLAGVPKAIATSARKREALRVLEMTGLLANFDAIVTVDDIVNGKPHPEPFLSAAALLGVAPERCLAFEDAPNGLRSARAAGMVCVGVGADPAPLAGLAEVVIATYFDPALDELLAGFAAAHP